jgi:hypothetical protein
MMVAMLESSWLCVSSLECCSTYNSTSLEYELLEATELLPFYDYGIVIGGQQCLEAWLGRSRSQCRIIKWAVCRM